MYSERLSTESFSLLIARTTCLWLAATLTQAQSGASRLGDLYHNKSQMRSQRVFINELTTIFPHRRGGSFRCSNPHTDEGVALSLPLAPPLPVAEGAPVSVPEGEPLPLAEGSPVSVPEGASLPVPEGDPVSVLEGTPVSVAEPEGPPLPVGPPGAMVRVRVSVTVSTPPDVGGRTWRGGRGPAAAPVTVK